MTERRVIGRPFPKGVSGNPAGKPKMAKDLQKIRVLNQSMFTELVNKYLGMTKEQILDAVKAPETPALELMIAQVMSKAIVNGDQVRLNFLLDRIVGKVPDRVQQTVTFKDSVDSLLEEFDKLNESSPT